MERDDYLHRLVAAAQRGDAASREDLLRAIRPSALRYLLAKGLPNADAEDLTQDVCLAVLMALPGWKDTGRPIWALVFTIARNKLADRGRRARPQALLDDGSALVDAGPGPDELVERDEGAEHVRELLAGLPATQADVLLLRVVVGLSTAETGEALGLTPGSVRVIQHRAVTALRGRLALTKEAAS